MSLISTDEIAVRDGLTTLLAPLSLQLDPGEPLIVLGETGSGKSLLAQAIMGTLPRNLIGTGQVAIARRVLGIGDRAAFRGLWGRELAVLPQEPWLSLDPLMRADRQVAEAHLLVRGLSRVEARTRAAADLCALGLAGAERQFPHQLSGGMAQRVAIAAARAGGARIVIADEPTKGLDAARRDEVADLLLTEMGADGGLLVITHDLALARRIGGQLIVLRDGAIVETGSTRQVLSAPQATYTRDLVAADPENWTVRHATPRPGPPMLEAQRLSLTRGGKPLFHDLDLEIVPGGISGVTGPSGCGKSSLGDALLGLLRPDQGLIRRSPEVPPTAFQKLYQDPVAAFPRHRTLGQVIADLMRLTGESAGKRDDLMDRLGLEPRLLNRRPEAVSGGELQRLALLRILLRQPAFVFADEPTSRLDPITQAKVMSLLTEIADRDGVAILLVSHDPALIRSTADGGLRLGCFRKAGGQTLYPM